MHLDTKKCLRDYFQNSLSAMKLLCDAVNVFASIDIQHIINFCRRRGRIYGDSWFISGAKVFCLPINECFAFRS